MGRYLKHAVFVLREGGVCARLLAELLNSRTAMDVWFDTSNSDISVIIALHLAFNP